jgi:hypothetical protein
VAIAHGSELVSPPTASAANTTAGNWDTSFTPGATPNGVCVIIAQGNNSSADQITSVVYGTGAGAVTLTRRRFQAKSTGEAGGIYIYWAGDGQTFPSGAQTVRVTRTGTTGMRLMISTMTVGVGKQVQLDSDNGGSSDSQANPSWTHSSLVNDVVAYLGIYSGLTTMTATPATNWTLQASKDEGAWGTGWARRTLATAGSLGAGWTAGTADDFVGASAAFKEGDPPAAAEGFLRRRGPNYRR